MIFIFTFHNTWICFCLQGISSLYGMKEINSRNLPLLVQMNFVTFAKGAFVNITSQDNDPRTTDGIIGHIHNIVFTAQSEISK